MKNTFNNIVLTLVACFIQVSILNAQDLENDIKQLNELILNSNQIASFNVIQEYQYSQDEEIKKEAFYYEINKEYNLVKNAKITLIAQNNQFASINHMRKWIDFKPNINTNEAFENQNNLFEKYLSFLKNYEDSNEISFKEKNDINTYTIQNLEELGINKYTIGFNTSTHFLEFVLIEFGDNSPLRSVNTVFKQFQKLDKESMQISDIVVNSDDKLILTSAYSKYKLKTSIQ